MARNANDRTSFQPPMYLSPNQQDAFLASLASNQKSAGLGLQNQNQRLDPMQFNFDGGFDQPLFPTDALDQTTSFGGDQVNDFDAFEDSPYLDVIDGTEGSYDFDIPEGGPAMFGALPGDDSPTTGLSNSESPQPEGHYSDKRKNSEDAEEPDEAKRRESDDKVSKKPGRKPLTTEPTTKRKAQNRAAQRAFRERKEKHLRDLETKVNELEQVSESTNHENGLLRAQVTRLQTELREYRKRLSLNASGLGASPPLRGGLTALSTSNGASSDNTFSFDFPRFGALPAGPQLFLKDNEKARSTSSSLNGRRVSDHASGAPSRSGSTGSMSPESQTSPAQNSTSTKGTSRTSADSVADPSRVFQFNSSGSNSASPSSSSLSQFGPNSSCGTSPEPSHNSPEKNLDKVNGQGYICHGGSEGEVTFCEQLNMACGNPRNPVPRSMSQSNASAKPTDLSPNPTSSARTTHVNVNGIDWLADQNGGQFDPLLFGEYRESQAAVVGDGDFTGGFFNDAFPIDLSSPFGTTGITPGLQSATKRNPMEEIDALNNADDDDEVVPGEDRSKMLSCHSIWDKLQDRPDFKEGSFDIDGLCTELRAKARCSESGVVVDQKDVDAALQRFPAKSPEP
ncbi:PAP1-domain-containing protein [Eremomyces bilateralis CBS 781.70]|uniref:PAP1-domain-containing protein n=1 Tax=Eremomyces bilateralis CBS 781.70 TaxID=1392243 RepID=A0A6G1FQJ7_9PEZI|nr:PAP1-domain-containing protein [Eremomyces bilateralis CBS 781.70]KAF1808016.1 PAP1-domain-containing protein [Eremomyces bilateralis CBS 781.70]